MTTGTAPAPSVGVPRSRVPGSKASRGATEDKFGGGRGVGVLGMLAVLDQGLFSGTNFLSAVLIGRYCGPEQLGAYALAFSLVMLAISMVRAGLISPYVVLQGNVSAETNRSLRAAMLMAMLLFGISLACVALMAGLWIPMSMSLALAVSLPAGLLRDFGRRLAIAEFRVRHATIQDAAILVIQIGALMTMAINGQLDAASALTVSGVVWSVAATVGWFVQRNHYQFADNAWKSNLMQLWPIGRWVGLTQIASTIQAFVMPWIMAVAHSAKLAGIYAACWALVQIASPAIEGLGNVLSPALARSVAQHSWRNLRYRVFVATTTFAAMMMIMLVFIMTLGRWALDRLYGAEYAGFFGVLVLLTLAATAVNLSIPAAKGLTQLGRPTVNLWATLTSLSVTVLTTVILLREVGEIGAACGLVAGGIVGGIARWFVLLRHFRSLANVAAPASGTALASVVGQPIKAVDSAGQSGGDSR
ncbi:MAG: hypothetical protein AAGA03_04860 [Planctomycetota bacterium]